MKYYIFGVSTGIGYALTQRLLKAGKKVYGFGRNNSINHENFEFLRLDLSNAAEVNNFSLPKAQTDFYVFYNSGILGEIKPTERQSQENAQKVFQVNYLSAVEISKKALAYSACKQIVFISSGAANRPISSWGQYGASKAALNYFAETLQQEIQEAAKDIIVKSIAPGVVDTPMQEEIRKSKPRDFPTVENFRKLKENQELSSPDEVARKLIFITENPKRIPQVCFSLRDIS